MVRFNRIALNKIVEQLENWVETTEEIRSNEEDKNYPNEDRLDELSTRIDAMEAAVASLQEID